MTNNNQKIVSVEIQKEFDVINKGWQDRVFVKLYTAARISGFLAEISDRDWKTLCVLATFMDSNGNCYPSQEEIAKALGISRQAANERIKSLVNYRWQGNPVVTLSKHRKETSKGKKGQRWDNNRYTILPLSIISFGDRRKTEKNPMSANDDIGKCFLTTKNKPMSENPDIGKRLDSIEEKPVSSFPVSGRDDTNYRCCNVVVERARGDNNNSNNKKIFGNHQNVQENTSNTDLAIKEIQELVRNNCNGEMSTEFVQSLLIEFSTELIKEKIKLISLSTGQIRNLPGLILSALKNNYVHAPGKPMNKNRAGPPAKCKIDVHDDNKRKELIKRLYFT